MLRCGIIIANIVFYANSCGKMQKQKMTGAFIDILIRIYLTRKILGSETNNNNDVYVKVQNNEY